MDETKSDDTGRSRALTARQLAEEGLHQQALGDDSEAERLLAEAQAADQDVERVLPRIVPGPATGAQ